MRYIGIDYGAQRIGIAVSDADGRIAFPETTIANDGNAIEKIAKLAREKQAMKIIMGDTRSVSGAENPVTAEADRFARKVEKNAGLPVETIFEAWSSIEVSRYAPQGASHDDAAAAAFILQRYLDMKSKTV